MYTLMNHYLNKISSRGVLRAPPGEGNPGGSSVTLGSQTQEESTQTGDDENGDDEESDLGEDLGIEEDSEFDIGEYVGYQQTDADKAAAAELKTNLEGLLEGMSLSDDVIPEDFDVSDPKQLREVIVASNRQTAQQILGMLIPVMNHGLGLAGKQMKHYIDAKGSQTKTQSTAAEAFQSLGLTDKNHVTLGKSLFQQALKAQNGDVTKALKATRKSFAALGITVKAGSSGGGSIKGNGAQIHSVGEKKGVNALNDLFGVQQNSK